MKRVAIFGNTGGGKSTLAAQLAEITQLPLYSLDKIKYRPGGEEVPHEEYLNIHAQLIEREAWIIDGFGCAPSTWARLDKADTWVYLDLPLALHTTWVTKRFFKGLWRTPEGWPEHSPLVKSTLNSYRVLWLCHKHLTPRYRQRLAETDKTTKQVHHLRSRQAVKAFLSQLHCRPAVFG